MAQAQAIENPNNLRIFALAQSLEAGESTSGGIEAVDLDPEVLQHGEVQVAEWR